jgi:hypothetical protein
MAARLTASSADGLESTPLQDLEAKNGRRVVLQPAGDDVPLDHLRVVPD